MAMNPAGDRERFVDLAERLIMRVAAGDLAGDLGADYLRRELEKMIRAVTSGRLPPKTERNKSLARTLDHLALDDIGLVAEIETLYERL